MSVYKEGFYAIEQLQKNSKPIFPDSADFGCPIKKGDNFWNLANQLVDWYGDKTTRKYVKYSTGESVRCVVTLMDEWAVSDQRKIVKEATEKFMVEFTSCNKGACKDKTGYIFIYKM